MSREILQRFFNNLEGELDLSQDLLDNYELEEDEREALKGNVERLEISLGLDEEEEEELDFTIPTGS